MLKTYVSRGILVIFAVLACVGVALADDVKEQLGGLLYFDEMLSINGNQACATCHLPPSFADPRNAADPVNNPVSLGSIETLNGGRNAPTAAYALFSPPFHFDYEEGLYVGGQFWDGRASTLVDQAKGPFLNPVEMAMPDKAAVLDTVMSHDNPNYNNYKRWFRSVYDVSFNDVDLSDPIVVNALYDMVADAIGAFETTKPFRRFTSKFDYYLKGVVSLSEQEQRGLDLFNGKAMCNLCHISEPTELSDGEMIPPLFTDFTYDNLGIPKSDNPLIADDPIDLGLGARTDLTEDPAGQLGKFKVSTLRNIAITAPYGHNGFFATLEEIVHFYNTRDVEAWPPPEVAQNVNVDELGDLGLTPEEEADVVAFLRTLTDGYKPKKRQNPIQDMSHSEDDVWSLGRR